MSSIIQLNPEQMIALASLTTEQINAIVSAAKDLKNYNDDVSHLKRYFSSLAASATNHMQNDQTIINNFRSAIDRQKEHKFYVLYDVDITTGAQYAKRFEMITAEEWIQQYSDIEFKKYEKLLMSNFNSQQVYIVINEINQNTNNNSCTDPKQLSMFKDVNNLTFVNRNNISVVRQILANFNISPK